MQTPRGLALIIKLIGNNYVEELDVKVVTDPATSQAPKSVHPVQTVSAEHLWSSFPTTPRGPHTPPAASS